MSVKFPQAGLSSASEAFGWGDCLTRIVPSQRRHHPIEIESDFRRADLDFDDFFPAKEMTLVIPLQEPY